MIHMIACDRCGIREEILSTDGAPKDWHIGFPFGDFDVCPRCLAELDAKGERP